MGRAQGKIGAAAAPGFDAVLGARRGINDADRQARTKENPFAESRWPLNPAEEEALAEELRSIAVLPQTKHDRDVYQQAFAHLNAQLGVFQNDGNNRLILHVLAKQLCNAMADDNLVSRTEPLVDMLGVPGHDVREQWLTFANTVQETCEAMSDLLKNMTGLHEETAVQLARNRTWAPMRAQLAENIFAAGDEPLRRLFDEDDTFDRLHALTKGMFGRSRFQKFMTARQWDEVLRQWDPVSGKQGLARMVAGEIEDRHLRLTVHS